MKDMGLSTRLYAGKHTYDQAPKNRRFEYTSSSSISGLMRLTSVLLYVFFLFNTTKGKKPSEYLSLWSYIAWQAMMVTARWKNLARQTALPLTSSMYDFVVDGQLLVPQLLCIFQFLHQQNSTNEERFKIYRQSVCQFYLPTLSSYISLGKWLNHFQDFSCSAVAMICRHLEAKPVQQKTINKRQLPIAGL